MPRPPSIFLLSFLVGLAAPAAWAQTEARAPATTATTVSPAADATTSPVFTPSAAVEPPPPIHLPPANDDHGDTRRIQSSELSTALVDSMPKFDPPKPDAAKPAAAEPDKPKNGIVRLPKYVVRDRRPQIFTDKDVLTEQGKKDAAMRTYLMNLDGANPYVAGGARILFQSYADQQYADAERAGNISTLQSDASLSSVGGDKGESDFIKAQSNDTYMRHQDWTDSIPTNRPDASTPR
jgi:hypothetical protein